MARLPTETALREWRFGQTQAERLLAALMHIEGYEGVDPQNPLGGPDGHNSAHNFVAKKASVEAASRPKGRSHAEILHV